MIRSFDWRDIPILHRYRSKELYLSSALSATRGTYFVSGVLLSCLSPTSGFFTSIFTPENHSCEPVIGQIVQLENETFARMSILAPADGIDTHNTRDVLGHLCQTAATTGATHLIAEPEERSSAFQILRSAGFTTYARQRIWKVHLAEENSRKTGIRWQYAAEQNFSDKIALFNNIVPGIVKQMEQPRDTRRYWLVQYTKDKMLGYADLIYGSRGIWVHPIVHLDVEDPEEFLYSLLQSIPARHNRAIHLCIRTYQSWLETAIQALGATSSALQAVMVKRLAIPAHVRKTVPLRQIESQPDAPIPLAQVKPFSKTSGKS